MPGPIPAYAPYAEAAPQRIPTRRQLIGLLRCVAAAEEGQRNQILFWATCRIREMLFPGLLDAEQAEALLTRAGMLAGLPEREAARTAQSGLRRGS